MREALCISSSEEALHLAFANAVSRLSADGGGEYEMAVANSLWGQDGAPLQPELGINGHDPPHEDSLFISDVFHKAIVEMNEEGTEASAATAVVMRTAAAWPKPLPVPTFRADHPFLFAIRDRATGALLFLGRVADPTRES
jgi:serpin B